MCQDLSGSGDTYQGVQHDLGELYQPSDLTGPDQKKYWNRFSARKMAKIKKFYNFQLTLTSYISKMAQNRPYVC